MPGLVPGIFVVCLFKTEGGKTMRVENRYDWPAVLAATAITITAAAVLTLAACYGHYEPGNCRWAIHSKQMLNRRKVGSSQIPN
jgi:hypothetical protein